MQLPSPEAARKTLLHRLPARVKLLGTLGLVIFTALMPRRATWMYLVPAGVVLGLWGASRLPWRQGFRRMLVAEFFILGIALFTLLSPAAFPLFLSALIKSNICVAAMIFLTWTTPFQQMLQVLRQLRVPGVMLSTLALMYRYMPVLAEEAQRMQRARASRTFVAGHAFAWGNLGTIVAQLFIRSVARAERIYLAMCARGWR